MNGLQKTMIATSCLVLSMVPVAAQTTTTKPTNVDAVAKAATVADMRPTTATARPTPAARHAATRVIVVSLEDRRLALVEDGAVTKVYKVAVGRDATPSPTGTFTIVQRVENPTYYHDGVVVPPGPGNPVGTRWIGLSQKGYGIHGTNAPRSIGHPASHGCIRLRNRDIEKLFTMVRVGDVVQIRGERDEQVAQVFGRSADDTTVAAADVAEQDGGHLQP